MDKYEVRGVFEKTGRAVFISHLDLFRTMQRAVKRSGIPVWYSEGYNPRIYLNFPLALSLGVESSAEIMDFEITEEIPYEKLMEDINRVLPGGLRFISMNAPVCKNRDIAYAEYIFEFCGENLTGKDISGGFDKMLSLDRIDVKKHSKSKGVVLLDIKPYINVVSSEITDKGFRAVIRLPAGPSLNINSNVFNDAFHEYGCPEITKISVKRTKILNKNGEIFA